MDAHARRFNMQAMAQNLQKILVVARQHQKKLASLQ